MTVDRRSLDLEQARQLYDEGLSFSQVGRQLGYSATYLARCFKAAGLRVRPSGRPLTTPPPTIHVQELVRLRDQGWTYSRLAERYAVSTDVVRNRYLRARGWPLSRAEAARRGVPFHPVQGEPAPSPSRRPVSPPRSPTST